jgi:membrane-associated protease RseP (regulator of RpoE activity)
LDPVRRDDDFLSSPFPELPAPGSGGDPGLLTPPPVWHPAPKFQDRRWLHLLLLLVTIGTTTIAGVGHYVGYAADFGAAAVTLPAIPLLIRGLWYSGTILAILGCHELGHYFACRYYDVDASLPYFLPVPFVLTGTLGAFIRIREPIPTKRMLFDIGIAGPLAGFVVAVPALVVGLAMSHVVRLPPQFTGFELGEPLLFKAVSWVLWGHIPDGYSLNMHPVAFAAWFGLLATALNLFPIGQLDGGHISYAVLGRRSTAVTLVMIVVAMVLTYFSMSWLVWTLLMIGMLVAFGPRHPRTFDEHVPLDRTRMILALVALIIFVLCFTPAPIEPLELLRH